MQLLKKKSNFCYWGKQSMIPFSDKWLQWVNAKPFRQISGIFRHNQAYPGITQTYSGIFKTLCNPGVFRTLVYPEFWQIQGQKYIQTSWHNHNFGIFREPRYIQNAGIFKIRGIFRTLPNIYDGAFCKNS